MIYVDKNKCISCGVCISICPTIFKYDENTGKAYLFKESIEGYYNLVKKAIKECPVDAIIEGDANIFNGLVNIVSPDYNDTN